MAVNLTNCLTVFIINGVEDCSQCNANYYATTGLASDYCLLWCTDDNCEKCQESTLYTCEKCYDGFHMKIVNGRLTCTLIPSTMIGCDRISFNQSYCYTCDPLYRRNERTGICEPILKTVRSYVNTVPPMPLNTLAANAVQDTFTTSIPIHASSTPSTNLIASQSNSSVPVTTASSVQTEWSSVLPGMAAVLAVWSLTVPSAKPTTIPFVQNAIPGFTLVLVKLPVSDALSTTAPNAPLPNV